MSTKLPKIKAFTAYRKRLSQCETMQDLITLQKELPADLTLSMLYHFPSFNEAGTTLNLREMRSCYVCS